MSAANLRALLMVKTGAGLDHVPVHCGVVGGDHVVASNDGRVFFVDLVLDRVTEQHQATHDKCRHRLRAGALPLQRNALRVEIMAPSDRCALMPKSDRFGRVYDLLRWIGSGGDPLGVAEPCVGSNSPRCPLRIEQ